MGLSFGFVSKGRVDPMLKYFVNTKDALDRLGADRAGVVSFEYITVAVCIVATVAVVFGVTGNSGFTDALSAGITRVSDGLNP
jgi:hypothetical protein